MIITFATVCHLLLAPQLLTSQLQPSTVSLTTTQIGSRVEQTVQWAPTDTQAAKPTAAVLPGELITSRAKQVEKVGDIYTLRGDVEVTFRRYTLKADEITYNAVSGEITATGHIVFDGGPHDEHITATRGSYNVNTESGTFYDVVGTTGTQIRGKNVSLTSSNPFSFVGARVDKKGPDKIIVHHGTVTSCRLPRPKWSFRAHQVEVVTGEDAKIYNTTFWLWRVPVFYFPFLDHPVERLGRKTGFLLPTIGRSSRKGYILGDSFYWAINRSMDATLGAEYYSRRGWAQHGDFRAKLTEESSIVAQYFGVVDRGIPTSSNDGKTIDQGGREVRVNASGVLRPGLRGVQILTI
jgi:LPS-assembly protein